MAEMASLWDFAEHRDMDQLGQKLLYTTLELEKLKSEAIEEMRKNKEYINQLIHLLKSAIQERDEARNNLQKLITTAAANSPTTPKSEIFHQPAKANSSITESNSLSGSVAVDSLFDAALSPEFSNMNHFNDFSSVQIMMPKIDRGSIMIENLAKGKILPEKGTLLKAVLQAGPLLQTLMVAGPLPRWRNPPQMQPFQIPPVAIRGGGDEGLGRKAALRQMSSSNCYDVAGEMPEFGNASLIPSAVSSNGCFRLPKRQRFC